MQETYKEKAFFNMNWLQYLEHEGGNLNFYIAGRSQWPRGLRPRKHWVRGFESHLRHECLCAFILCLYSVVCK
jgi:hypothetical protein